MNADQANRSVTEIHAGVLAGQFDLDGRSLWHLVEVLHHQAEELLSGQRHADGNPSDMIHLVALLDDLAITLPEALAEAREDIAQYADRQMQLRQAYRFGSPVSFDRHELIADA